MIDANRQLIETIKSGNKEKVKVLLDAGADVNSPPNHNLKDRDANVGIQTLLDSHIKRNLLFKSL